MNSMTKALVDAGVKVPTTTQRIWEHLKFNGAQHAGAVANALQLKGNDAASALSLLYKRGMVARSEEQIVKGGKTYHRYLYTTVGKTFQMLPVPKKVVEKPPKPAAPIVVVPAPALLPEPPALVVTGKVDVESLTVAEARALYLELKAVFGGKL